jgi:putative hemolysin
MTRSVFSVRVKIQSYNRGSRNTVITYLSLVIGELVPKRLALPSPERVASIVAGPMSALSRIGAPIVAILSWSTDALLKLFRLQASKEPAVTEDDVRGLLRQGAQTGVFEPAEEQQIVERVFQFADRRVSGIMTPRSDIVWLDLNDNHAVWRREISGTPYSRPALVDLNFVPFVVRLLKCVRHIGRWNAMYGTKIDRAPHA